jgi:hypothetical protein
MACLFVGCGESEHFARELRAELYDLARHINEEGAREAWSPLMERTLAQVLFTAFPSDRASREEWTKRLSPYSYQEMEFRYQTGIPTPTQPVNELLKTLYPNITRCSDTRTHALPDAPRLWTDGFTDVTAVWVSGEPLGCRTAKVWDKKIWVAEHNRLGDEIYPREIVDFCPGMVVGDTGGFVYTSPTRPVTHVPGLFTVQSMQSHVLLGGRVYADIWDLERTERIHQYRDSLTALWTSGDVVYCGTQASVCLWDIRGMEASHTFVGNRESISSIHGKEWLLATGSRDSTCVFDTRKPGFPMYRLPALMETTPKVFVRPHVVHVARQDTMCTYSLDDGERLTATRMPFTRIVNFAPLSSTEFGVLCAGHPNEVHAMTEKVEMYDPAIILLKHFGVTD